MRHVVERRHEEPAVLLVQVHVLLDLRVVGSPGLLGLRAGA